MGKPTGFMEIPREMPTRRPVSQRIHDFLEVYNPFPEEKLRAQGARCMDCGIPFCHQGCPLGNLIPDWNDLVYRDQWRAAIERLHATNNFPEFTGKLCPAPVRGVVRPGDQQRPGHDQADRGQHHRTGVGRGLGRPAAAQDHDRQERGGRRLGPGRAGLRPAARPGRPRGHRLRASRPHRRPAPLRHPRLQDGEATPRPPPRADGSRGRRLPPGVNVGVDVTARAAARRVRRGLPLRRLDPAARPADRGPRARRHPLRHGIPDRARTGGSPAIRSTTRIHLGPRQATSSSSAAATPAPIAWGPSIARGAGASTSSRSSPGPPMAGHLPTPGPSGPTSSASPRPTRRGASASTRSTPGGSSARTRPRPRPRDRPG